MMYTHTREDDSHLNGFMFNCWPRGPGYVITVARLLPCNYDIVNLEKQDMLKPEHGCTALQQLANNGNHLMLCRRPK